MWWVTLFYHERIRVPDVSTAEYYYFRLEIWQRPGCSCTWQSPSVRKCTQRHNVQSGALINHHDSVDHWKQVSQCFRCSTIWQASVCISFSLWVQPDLLLTSLQLLLQRFSSFHLCDLLNATLLSSRVVWKKVQLWALSFRMKTEIFKNSLVFYSSATVVFF